MKTHVGLIALYTRAESLTASVDARSFFERGLEMTIANHLHLFDLWNSLTTRHSLNK